MNLRVLMPITIALAMGTLLFLPADAFGQGLDIGKLNSKCMTTELDDCTVISSGRLNAQYGEEAGAPLIAWQTQRGLTDYGGLQGGFVLLAHSDGEWSVLDKGFEAAAYDPPRLSEDGTVLHIPGYSAGTGAFNEDRLYVWGDIGAAMLRDDWQRIDIDSWFETAEPMLPEGLGIWKGVDYDFSDWFYGGFNARSPLWRAEDGNCCPSGGWATIHFDLDTDARKIVPRAVDYTPPAAE